MEAASSSLEARRVQGEIASRVWAATAGIIFTLALVVAWNWPFTREKFVRNMEHFASAEVQVSNFRGTFLPHPGYVAENVVFLRPGGGRKVVLARAERITCVGTWANFAIFRHRVNLLQITGLHVTIPSPVPKAVPYFPEMQAKVTVSKLVADGAVLEIAPRNEDGGPLRFEFRSLALGEVKAEKSISLDTSVRIPKVPGQLNVHGRFGPFEHGKLGQTPLGGSFELLDANLGETAAVTGRVMSRGQYEGVLARCAVRGTVRVKDFAIKKVQHAMDLDGAFATNVDGIQGNVVIHSTRVRFLQTELNASGVIESEPGGRGKVERLNFTSDRARIEDLLWLFSQAEKPAVSGPMRLKARVTLPPGHAEFLKKVVLAGDFEIPEAHFKRARTRTKVNELSERARGKKVKESEAAQEELPAGVGAEVSLRNATAKLTEARFETPGARAVGEGTYNLLTEEVNLRGKLAMDARLSKAAGGWKSVLLLPLDPLFKKDGAGAVVPIRVTGTYSHPAFRVSLTGR